MFNHWDDDEKVSGLFNHWNDNNGESRLLKCDKCKTHECQVFVLNDVLFDLPKHCPCCKDQEPVWIPFPDDGKHHGTNEILSIYYEIKCIETIREELQKIESAEKTNTIKDKGAVEKYKNTLKEKIEEFEKFDEYKSLMIAKKSLEKISKTLPDNEKALIEDCINLLLVKIAGKQAKMLSKLEKVNDILTEIFLKQLERD